MRCLRVVAVAAALLLMISACSSAPTPQAAAPSSAPTAQAAATSSAPTAQAAAPSSAPTAQAATSAPTAQAATSSAPTAQAATSAPTTQAVIGDVVVYASDLPESALSEFEIWDDPAAPGGKMVGTPNTGGHLDPPPEDDPHVTFSIPVQGDVPYRCWVHMKVGAPQGESQANMLWVQLSDAVDKANQEILKPDTGSYLTAQGPTQAGWTWVGCDLANSDSLIYFRASGEITVRMQAGMEGVGFDQFVLSPAQYLQQPPSEAIVKK